MPTITLKIIIYKEPGFIDTITSVFLALFSGLFWFNSQPKITIIYSKYFIQNDSIRNVLPASIPGFCAGILLKQAFVMFLIFAEGKKNNVFFYSHRTVGMHSLSTSISRDLALQPIIAKALTLQGIKCMLTCTQGDVWSNLTSGYIRLHMAFQYNLCADLLQQSLKLTLDFFSGVSFPQE